LVAVCAAVALAVVGGILGWRWLAAEPASSEAEAGSIGTSVGAAPQNADDLRISVGATNPYIDRSGWTWGPDRFFTGGSVLVRSSEKVARTLDPDIYRRLRQGEFRYDIPLKPGSYELHLHFAETGLRDAVSAESSGQGLRLFHVSANGRRILEGFDIAADAPGGNVADERVFRDISPADDGFLHLSFVSVREPAILNGIELLPVSPGKVRPIRIRAGWPSSWADSAGRHWQADSYFTEGNALVRRTNPARESDGPEGDLPLYSSERWGHFSYTVPVAEGRYRITLKFCEGHYGPRNTGVGGVGSRVFDVYCNGAALLKNFDISKEAGGEGRPLDRTFSGIRPTAQGKIALTFVPVKGMACVNGIEIADASK
jgi:hypothetical protein